VIWQGAGSSFYQIHMFQSSSQTQTPQPLNISILERNVTHSECPHLWVRLSKQTETRGCPADLSEILRRLTIGFWNVNRLRGLTTNCQKNIIPRFSSWVLHFSLSILGSI
jgi:hypothetical protein